MWQYVLLIILPLMVHHFKVKQTVTYACGIDNVNNRNRNAMALFWGMLTVLLLLRHESVGRDLPTYRYIFNFISRSSWSRSIWRSAEIGFNFLIKSIASLTGSFRLLIIVSAILGVYPIAKAYVKYSEDASLTIAVFLIMSNFVLFFSGLKQTIAISIGFIAFEFVKKKKLVQFAITVCIAMMFHASAFMIAFMYPLYHVRITKKWLWGIVPALVLVFAFNEQIFEVLTAFLMLFTDYYGTVSNTGAYTMLILFAGFAVFSYIVPDETTIDSDTIGMRNFLLMAIVIQMFAPLHTLAMRMNYYYIAFIPLLLPKVIKNRSERWNQVAVIFRHIMVVFFVMYFFATAPNDNVLDTFPYRFVWESI